MAASGPRQLRLQAPITDRIGTEDVKVLRFVLGPVMSVPPDRPFVVPGHRYVFEPPAPGDYTLEVRPACPDCPVHPRCSGFEVLPAPGSGLYGGCGTLLAFDVEGTDAIRFTVSERDSPTGPSDLPRSLCGDYVVELRPGVPECLRPSSAR